MGSTNLCKRLNIVTPGHFGVLRHVRRNAATEPWPTNRTDAEYRERIGDDRLRTVAEQVLGWLVGRDGVP